MWTSRIAVWTAIALPLCVSVPVRSSGQDAPHATTGGDGSNQAAGPSGQHPGRVGGADPAKVAVFDFQLSNLGQQAPTDADYARLPRLSDMFRGLLAESGRYDIVSTAPLKDEVAKSSDLRSCGGCAETFAKQVGATIAVTGEIQKVSNLILNINVYFKRVGSSVPETAYSVDIRGDNDLSFDHGIRYIVKHNILKQ